MATSVSLSYSAASGAGIHAGRYPGGRLSGTITLVDVAPGGGLGSAAAVLGGNVALSDVAPGGGLSVYTPIVVTAGTIQNINTNTRASINPRYTSANPNNPALAPWEVSGSWDYSVANYSGAVFLPELGAAGTYVQYGGAGHSAVNACAMFGFDVATLAWKMLGAPLPSDSLALWNGPPPQGSTPYSDGRLDLTWGDYDGGHSAWGSRTQPGKKIPAGGHSRGSWHAIPASAGHAAGQIVVAWQMTGQTGGEPGFRGGWVWDAATDTFRRAAALRFTSGTGDSLNEYCALHNVGVGWDAGGQYSSLSYFDPATDTWTTRTMGNSLSRYYDHTTAFVCDDLFVVSQAPHNTATMPLYAAQVSKLLSNTSQSWVTLTVDSTAGLPLLTNYGFSSPSVGGVYWSLCPTNGCYYAVNRQSGSHSLWKLTPPAGDAAAKLAGTWVVSVETLGGAGLQGGLFDYNRLRWAPSINAFLWTGENGDSLVQAIRPSGV